MKRLIVPTLLLAASAPALAGATEGPERPSPPALHETLDAIDDGHGITAQPDGAAIPPQDHAAAGAAMIAGN